MIILKLVILIWSRTNVTRDTRRRHLVRRGLCCVATGFLRAARIKHGIRRTVTARGGTLSRAGCANVGAEKRMVLDDHGGDTEGHGGDTGTGLDGVGRGGGLAGGAAARLGRGAGGAGRAGARLGGAGAGGAGGAGARLGGAGAGRGDAGAGAGATVTRRRRNG